jgi:hypothetical protein
MCCRRRAVIRHQPRQQRPWQRREEAVPHQRREAGGCCASSSPNTSDQRPFVWRAVRFPYPYLTSDSSHGYFDPSAHSGGVLSGWRRLCAMYPVVLCASQHVYQSVFSGLYSSLEKLDVRPILAQLEFTEQLSVGAGFIGSSPVTRHYAYSKDTVKSVVIASNHPTVTGMCGLRPLPLQHRIPVENLFPNKNLQPGGTYVCSAG